MWLWTKYVTGFNEKYHCTNSITGRYSRTLWKGNPDLQSQRHLVLDEEPQGSYRALYVCGVSRAGYSSRKNYAHNVHAAIQPAAGLEDEWRFENWVMSVRNGVFLLIPQSVDDLPVEYRNLPESYVTCRIFRWATVFFDLSA
jgi:hypothetical protein